MKIPRIFQERDPTKGCLIKNSLFITIPLWINTIFWLSVNLLNLFWVSRLGEESIAIVGIGGAAFAILMAVIQGIGTAAYSLVGSFNREDKEGLDKLVKQMLSIIWIASLALAIFGFFSAPILLKLLGAEPEVVSSAVAYFRICSLGGIISFSFWPLLKIIRSSRDMFRPMLFMAFVLAVQAILDYLLIFGVCGLPKLGVMGAAWSATISAALGAVLALWMIAKGNMFIKINFRDWRDFKITLKTLKDVFHISCFDTVEGLTRMVIAMVMFGIIASFGILSLAAFTIGQRFFKYSSQFGFDVGETTAIVLSNNLGVRDFKRAKASGWINAAINAFLMGICGLAFFLFAERIIGFFSQSPEVIAIGSVYLKITGFAGLGYVFFAVGTALRRAFAGAGDTRTPLAVYLAMAAIQIGLSFLLPRYFGLGINGVWFAMLASTIFYGSALAILFKIRRWKIKN